MTHDLAASHLEEPAEFSAREHLALCELANLLPAWVIAPSKPSAHCGVSPACIADRAPAVDSRPWSRVRYGARPSIHTPSRIRARLVVARASPPNTAHATLRPASA